MLLGVVRPPQPIPLGLCASCAHRQLVRTGRGSEFSLCRRSREDPAYPKYPQIPVLTCPGHERRAAPS